jgi:hypothetical protein
MPTRIITASSLAGTPGRGAVVQQQQQQAAAGIEDTLSRMVRRAGTVSTPPPRIGTSSNHRNPTHSALRTPIISNRRGSSSEIATTKSGSVRRVVGFRSSIIRELSTPKKPGEEDDSEYEEEEPQIHLSTTDIRASPRLVGYLFALVASTVMLVSVVKFYQTRNVGGVASNHHVVTTSSKQQQQQPAVEVIHPRAFLSGFDQTVYRWKFWGAVSVASAGVGLNLGIMLVHFDTIFFPRLWFNIFRDGSRGEGTLLICLLVFWAAGLHTCTSSLSVGSSQANVYFTTWIGFGATCLNYGVWRISAKLPSLAEQLVHHERETTYNWAWTLLFVCITAGAATDLYYNRDYLVFHQDGLIIQVSHTDWLRALFIPWGLVVASVTALALNFYNPESAVISCGSRYRLVVGWRQLEGLVILGVMGVFFWIIFKYTGVNGFVTGLNNAYFGIWGSFFNSVFTFGTWLRENKNIEYLVRVGQEQDEEEDEEEGCTEDAAEATSR